MKLELSQIKDLIDNPSNAATILIAQKEHKKLNMHVNGVGIQGYLGFIQNYENEDQKKLRHKLARSNKSKFTNLLRPVDKIFSAKGGSRHYDLRDEKAFKVKLRSLNKGGSLQKWIENQWLNKYITDPNGIVLMEVKDSECYPTLKSINCILDYQKTGRQYEYIIFEPIKTEEGNYYRVIDDDFDRMVKYSGSEITEIEDQTFPNHWGRVPAVVNSDIIDPIHDKKISPIDAETELADELLRDTSIRTIFKFLFGFPRYWEYMRDCKQCKGSGQLKGEDCHYCKGTGYQLKRDVSEILGLEFPADGETPVSPDVAGYVVPPIEMLQEMRTEAEWFTAAIHYSHWGTHNVDKERQETATGRFIDVQPVNDRLNKYSDAAEFIEGVITDFIGEFHYENYKGSSINYGRRFHIETADAVWERYLKAKKDGASKVTLNYLLIEFYQSEFHNDSVELAYQIKLIKIEPFVHSTDKEILGAKIEQEDYLKKIYFPEWLKTITRDAILFGDDTKLNSQLIEYVKPKIQKNETEIV